MWFNFGGHNRAGTYDARRRVICIRTITSFTLLMVSGPMFHSLTYETRAAQTRLDFCAYNQARRSVYHGSRRSELLVRAELERPTRHKGMGVDDTKRGLNRLSIPSSRQQYFRSAGR